MTVAAFPHWLERIYAVPIAPRVDDFLVTDRDVARVLDTSPNPRACDEKLLLCELDGGLELSLFIDEALIERLRRNDPWSHLHEHNLGDFCVALEGVSHFHYVVHRASQSRQVTLLELELQAEVDKYVVVHSVLRSQGKAAAPRALRARMFDGVRFDETLWPDELDRYRDANALARRYCEQLETQFFGNRSRAAYFEELRCFYEMDQAAKLRRISKQS